MSHRTARRQLTRLVTTGLIAGLLVGAGHSGDNGLTTTGSGPTPGQDAAIEDIYYRALEKNTRWVETQWDPQQGVYSATNSAFVSVLGNAVLLEYGDYDPELTGIDRATLRDHTLRTIEHYAASNRYNGGSQWGGRIFWDATNESYFIAAARILWDELDPSVREQIDRIAAGEADYMAELGEEPDPRSGGWTSNGLDGGYVGDSKIEEMGNQSMALAPAVAYLPDDPRAETWRHWMDAWLSNLTGLPVADDNNPTVVAGQTVAERNRAQNLFPGYLVENHGSYNPHYHQSAWVYPARNAIHFLLAGRPLPETLLRQPNGDGLWRTTHLLTTAAGVSAYPAVADRLHLYGRDVLPLAGRHLLYADPYAARAELMLASLLEAYVDHPPSGRLTKFSGEPHYEPEARAELAIAYLLHRWRDRLPGGDITPVSETEFFVAGSGVADWGAEAGLAAQQTGDALAMTVTKPNLVKFAWLPGHDDWLFEAGGTMPFLLPSTRSAVESRSVHTYSRARDGYDATASVIKTPEGYAGFTTLPDGSAVYASTGLGRDEGVIRLYNFAMAGVPGLDGDRTFTSADGSRTLAAGPAPDGLGDGGLDVVTFEPTEVRHLRMQGIRPGTQYGYSIWTLAARSGADGPDLAEGRPATASTSYPGYPADHATDGDPQTRWAVSVEGRTDPASWLAVDLGEPTTVDRVEISWQGRDAYGVEYRVQGSSDGVTWRDLRTVVPSPPGERIDGSWVNVEDRAGFVVRDGNGIWIAPEQVTLSGGDPADVLVEAHPATADETRRLAAAPAPSGGPPALRAALTGGYLSLLNLGGTAIEDAQLTVPQRHVMRLYDGVQRLGSAASTYAVTLPPGSARVAAPRFTLTRLGGSHADAPPLRAEVTDSTRMRLTNLDESRPARLTVRSTQSGQATSITLAPGEIRTLTFAGRPLPTPNLATGRTTYPGSPRPAGTTSPAMAVDGNPATAWRPGPAARMVVDLGSAQPIATVAATWTPGKRRGWTVAVSDDGLEWQPAGTADAGRPVRLQTTARYVAIEIPGWRAGDARLGELSVTS